MEYLLTDLNLRHYTMNAVLYTIGYSAFPDPAVFISTLKEYRVDTVIDVRSVPSSSVFPQYDASVLPDRLIQEGITYLSFASEFGERQQDESLYKDGRLDYEAFASTESFRRGISRLEFGLSRDLIPVLMSEDADPASGHRGILVSRALSSLGYQVFHITPAGLKEHKELEEDLIEMAKEKLHADSAQMSFLPTDAAPLPINRQELLELGYRLKNDEIGFPQAKLT